MAIFKYTYLVYEDVSSKKIREIPLITAPLLSMHSAFREVISKFSVLNRFYDINLPLYSSDINFSCKSNTFCAV